MTGKASTFRHRFHQENFKSLFLIALGVGGGTAVLILYFLNPTTLSVGLVMGGVAIGYLLCQRFLSFMKEVVGAVLYTIGVLVPVASNAGFDLTNPKLFLIFQFFLVVLMNLILFSFFDKKNDVLNKQSSFATAFGSSSASRLVWVIFLFAMVISMVNIFFFAQFQIPGIIIFAMTFLLAAIQFFPTYFSQYDRFRFVGDGIFFLPLFYLLF